MSLLQEVPSATIPNEWYQHGSVLIPYWSEAVQEEATIFGRCKQQTAVIHHIAPDDGIKECL